MTLGVNSEKVREALLLQYESGMHHLLLDCSQLTMVDSSGLGEIVASYSAIVRRGGSLKLLKPTARLRELLKTTRLDSLLETYEDEPTAIASFHSDADVKAHRALDAFLK